MSLSVDVYTDDPVTGERHYLKRDQPSLEMAGPERWRKDLWGADIMNRLGLTLLPTLREIYGVYGSGEDLDPLEREAQVILQNAELIHQETRETLDDIREYTQNILDAIAEARKIQATVIIW